MLLDNSFISEHEGAPGFVGVIIHSTANRINCTIPLLTAAFFVFTAAGSFGGSSVSEGH